MSRTFDNHKESRLNGTRGTVIDMSWSSDGSQLTAAESKGHVRTWRLGRGGHKEGEEIRTLGSDIEHVAWCTEPGKQGILAAAKFEKTVHLWDSTSNSIASSIATSGANTALVWSPSGKYLAVLSRDARIEIFDAANLEAPVVTLETEETVHMVRWDTREELLLLATHHGAVEVYSWPNVEHVHTVAAHVASLNCLGVEPRGDILATGGADSSMQFWRTDDLSVYKAIEGYESPLRLIDFSMNSKFVASASDDADILIHDVYSGDKVKSIHINGLVTAMAWNPRNLIIAYAAEGAVGRSASSMVAMFGPVAK
ncbi:WD40 repeat-like protein [Linderina pennispora]|uniref:WD40 repeat-like protein n=1 Tax=Linderina pennispora TaxID=61395 RepID=A0A1Y1W0F4_9FUNG|nr:WD40 repeat-like protein [Linderina pennispora]ORX66594.1 WD40 repeat-like protein [Linderina pennispora]